MVKFCGENPEQNRVSIDLDITPGRSKVGFSPTRLTPALMMKNDIWKGILDVEYKKLTEEEVTLDWMQRYLDKSDNVHQQIPG